MIPSDDKSGTWYTVIGANDEFSKEDSYEIDGNLITVTSKTGDTKTDYEIYKDYLIVKMFDDEIPEGNAFDLTITDESTTKAGFYSKKVFVFRKDGKVHYSNENGITDSNERTGEYEIADGIMHIKYEPDDGYVSDDMYYLIKDGKLYSAFRLESKETDSTEMHG